MRGNAATLAARLPIIAATVDARLLVRDAQPLSEWIRQRDMHAIEAGVPILPVVSIGGQEDQFHISRGEMLARFSPLARVSSRMPYFPVSFGFPFGFTPAFPINLPLPTKITTQVLEPVDIAAEFGPEPDVAQVDKEIRSRMQQALDVLASQRRFPVLG